MGGGITCGRRGVRPKCAGCTDDAAADRRGGERNSAHRRGEDGASLDGRLGGVAHSLLSGLQYGARRDRVYTGEPRKA